MRKLLSIQYLHSYENSYLSFLYLTDIILTEHHMINSLDDIWL